MIWKRVILWWMTLLALVFASASATSATNVGPKSHVGAIDLAVATCIEVSGLASVEEHRGNPSVVTTAASDVPHAARGAYKAGARMSDKLLFAKDKFAKGVQHVTEARRTISKSGIGAERAAFLGDDFVKVGPGKWRSIDGARQFRVKPNDFAGNHGNIGGHVHMEFLKPNASGTKLLVRKNVHIPLR